MFFDLNRPPALLRISRPSASLQAPLGYHFSTDLNSSSLSTGSHIEPEDTPRKAPAPCQVPVCLDCKKFKLEISRLNAVCERLTCELELTKNKLDQSESATAWKLKSEQNSLRTQCDEQIPIIPKSAVSTRDTVEEPEKVNPLRELTSSMVSELKQLKHPPAPVQLVLEALALLLGFEKTRYVSSYGTPVNYADSVRRALLSDPSLISRMRVLDIKKVEEPVLTKIGQILASTSPQRVHACSKTAAIIYQWMIKMVMRSPLRSSMKV